MISDDYTRVDPNSIIVDRENRQRKKVDPSGLVESIRRNGVFHAIIVTKNWC